MPVDPWDDDADETPAERRAANLGPDPPQAPTPNTDPSDVDPEVQSLFWRSVLMANVALFCLTFAPMLIYFRGQWRLGGGIAALGVVAGVRVYHLYRTFERRGDDDGRNP
ncbi:hypothetical protein ACFR97_10870 [Haloplanus litoreus]|uniref:DUF7322 domain-containing protein n=1 Tax=Haloplanus litoreus TaxID=767515 RepID=A0ABD6A2W2_9EURY